jgi:hypothetical protein
MAPVGDFALPSMEGATGRGVALAGYEIHSIDVEGSDNLLTYDDSNLFFHRSGSLNGNTGDTATSGLNVVDSLRSLVRSGNSLDAGNPSSSRFDPARSAPSFTSPLSRGVVDGASASVADVNGVSTANGQDTLVIGGDGVDDESVRIRGSANVATYDDGNLTVGGIGDVNAQIGDSETSGAVVMAVKDSDVVTGDSLLSRSEQASDHVGDSVDAPTPPLDAAPLAPLGNPSPGAM